MPERTNLFPLSMVDLMQRWDFIKYYRDHYFSVWELSYSPQPSPFAVCH